MHHMIYCNNSVHICLWPADVSTGRCIMINVCMPAYVYILYVHIMYMHVFFLCVSQSLSLSLCVSLSHSLSLARSLSRTLSLSLCLSLAACLCVCMCVFSLKHLLFILDTAAAPQSCTAQTQQPVRQSVRGGSLCGCRP
jgi:hypothetical protein